MTKRTFPYPQCRCPSNHWNPGDDICEDCGTDLQSPTGALWEEDEEDEEDEDADPAADRGDWEFHRDHDQ